MNIGPTISLGGIIWTQWKIRRERIAYYDNEGVTIRRKGIRFRNVRKFPYSAFNGLAHHRHTIDTQYSVRSFEVIELIHPHEDNNVALYIGRDGFAAQHALADYASRLNLPILDRETCSAARS